MIEKLMRDFQKIICFQKLSCEGFRTQMNLIAIVVSDGGLEFVEWLNQGIVSGASRRLPDVESRSELVTPHGVSLSRRS